MKCPGCGAMADQAMLAAGECGYCHSALVDPDLGARRLADAVERLAERPKQVVHVTKVELVGPDVGAVAGGVFDSLTARIAGCFTGCLSTGVTLVVTGMILAFVAWQLWVTQARMPPIPPPPAPPAAHPDHGPDVPGPTPKKGKRH